MAYEYNNVINRSKNEDRETNKQFNNNIMTVTSTKKKSSQADIDIMVNKTYEKIFDVIKYNDKNYFLDKELGLILNGENNISGLYSKNKNIWLDEENKLQEQIQIENKEFENIIKNYLK